MGKVAGSAGRGSGGRPVEGTAIRRANGTTVLTGGIIDTRGLNQRQTITRTMALLAAEDLANPDPTIGVLVPEFQRRIRNALTDGVVTEQEIQRVSNMRIGGQSRLQRDMAPENNRENPNRDYRFRTNTGQTFVTPETNPRFVAAAARRMAVERGATFVEYIGRGR